MARSKEAASRLAPHGVTLNEGDRIANYRDFSAILYPVAKTCIGPLTAGTKYDYQVELVMPETAANLDAGSFMIRLFIYPDGFIAPENPHVPPPSAERYDSPSGRTIGRPTVAFKSVSLRYKSSFRRKLFSVVFALPIALGLPFFEEEQRVEAVLIQDLSHAGDSADACLAVTLNNAKLQVYDGKLTVTAKLEGLRYWCYHWFWTCFLLGTSLLFCFYGLIALALFLVAYAQVTRRKAKADQTIGKRSPPQRRSPSPSRDRVPVGMSDSPFLRLRRPLSVEERGESRQGFDENPRQETRLALKEQEQEKEKEKERASSADGDDENKPVKIETGLLSTLGVPAGEKPADEENITFQKDPESADDKDDDEDSAAGTGLSEAGPPVDLTTSSDEVQ